MSKFPDTLPKVRCFSFLIEAIPLGEIDNDANIGIRGFTT